MLLLFYKYYLGAFEFMKVLVETSARHVHLTKKDFETLFGNDAKLTVKKELSQPGQFACNERVTVVGPKKSIENIVVLGPERSTTQVEISLTDARLLGIDVPIRLSGDTKNSGSCKLVGPKGELDLEEGVIAVKRHIHMSPEEAAMLGFENNGDIPEVMVKVESADRALVFDNVSVRVDNNFKLAMHIDTDEANAAGCVGKVYGEIIKK